MLLGQENIIINTEITDTDNPATAGFLKNKAQKQYSHILKNVGMLLEINVQNFKKG